MTEVEFALADRSLTPPMCEKCGQRGAKYCASVYGRTLVAVAVCGWCAVVLAVQVEHGGARTTGVPIEGKVS